MKGDEGRLERGASAAITMALQCVAVCCSVLQCVAVCCSVLQCAASAAITMASCAMPHTSCV